MILPREIYTESPPEPRTQLANNPTLLFSWWCTGFATVIILLRVAGRYIRTEKLFTEDKVMFWSLIPLYIRMGLVHVILLYGTNNINPASLDASQIHRRVVGSKLVLASRIFYAMFIWVAKWSVSEFLKRTISTSWTRSYELGLRAIRVFLIITFIAVVIATLSECKPFDHYWQVVPTPAPHCRQGFAQLITMGTADIITDILLVVFPIVIVAGSNLSIKRKIVLACLFSLSAGLIAVTAYRVPAVIHTKGKQQFRSLLASCEILGAAAVANAVVLGSFLRDRGVKKNKYRANSVADSLDKSSARRPTLTAQHWGSDEDLVKGLCYRLDPELQRTKSVPRPPPLAAAAMPPKTPQSRKDSVMDSKWQFPKSDSSSADSKDSEARNIDPNTRPNPNEYGQIPMSFADVGGLLERSLQDVPPETIVAGNITARDFVQQGGIDNRALLADLGGLSLAVSNTSLDTTASPRTNTMPPKSGDIRRGSFSRLLAPPSLDASSVPPMQQHIEQPPAPQSPLEGSLPVLNDVSVAGISHTGPRQAVQSANPASTDSNSNWPLFPMQGTGQTSSKLSASDEVSAHSSTETSSSWFVG